MTFGSPPIGKRGYNEDDVDAFVAHVVARLEGRGRLTADDVHNVAFSKPALFKRGYNEDEVDAFSTTSRRRSPSWTVGMTPPSATTTPNCCAAGR